MGRAMRGRILNTREEHKREWTWGEGHEGRHEEGMEERHGGEGMRWHGGGGK